ncbi:hypothetical protein [Neisseria iguanae]|uniref:Uncharacterized protein n=1 Tax=Neisseria iguanae TaxID=90242 RepID=A0A2P7TXQ5_9NEIS|nr:hypothetical protein [Neisseria iguanae]PSJ79496.1 hypothetical protein C7N83_11860 [Neisseria iguanae]
MDTKKPNFSSQTENDFNWERRLEQLRQTRRINAHPTHAPLIRESKDLRPNAAAKADRPYGLDQKSRDKILQEYMRKWQEEHNAGVAQHEDIVTDDMVLLQENWLGAQSALQMRVSEKHIESTRTVWFNPKHQTVEFPEPAAAGDTPSEIADEIGLPSGSDNAPDQKIMLNINILNPQAIGRREVFCVSEQELAERLIKRMRPHVTDAVNGMIRVALQKQMAVLSYNLQQTLNEQVPALVEDLLEHNVKKVLADLKYEMKYKRGKQTE